MSAHGSFLIAPHILRRTSTALRANNKVVFLSNSTIAGLRRGSPSNYPCTQAFARQFNQIPNGFSSVQSRSYAIKVKKQIPKNVALKTSKPPKASPAPPPKPRPELPTSGTTTTAAAATATNVVKQTKAAQGPSLYSYLQSNEVKLYDSKNLGLTIVCYTICATALGWAYWEYTTHVRDVPYAPAWTRNVARATCVLGCCGAAYAYWLPSRAIKSITSIPRAKGVKTDKIMVKLRTGSLMPFMTRTIITGTKEVEFRGRLFSNATQTMNTKSQGGWRGILDIFLFPFRYPYRKILHKISLQDYTQVKINGGSIVFLLNKNGTIWERESRLLTRIFPFPR